MLMSLQRLQHSRNSNNSNCVANAICVMIYKISYDLSYDYLKFVVRSTLDSDLQHAKISLRNIVS